MVVVRILVFIMTDIIILSERETQSTCLDWRNKKRSRIRRGFYHRHGYKFQKAPISLGLDIKPFVDINSDFFAYWDGAFICSIYILILFRWFNTVLRHSGINRAFWISTMKQSVTLLPIRHGTTLAGITTRLVHKHKKIIRFFSGWK